MQHWGTRLWSSHRRFKPFHKRRTPRFVTAWGICRGKLAQLPVTDYFSPSPVCLAENCSGDQVALPCCCRCCVRCTAPTQKAAAGVQGQSDQLFHSLLPGDRWGGLNAVLQGGQGRAQTCLLTCWTARTTLPWRWRSAGSPTASGFLKLFLHLRKVGEGPVQNQAPLPPIFLSFKLERERLQLCLETPPGSSHRSSPMCQCPAARTTPGPWLPARTGHPVLQLHQVDRLPLPQPSPPPSSSQRAVYPYLSLQSHFKPGRQKSCSPQKTLPQKCQLEATARYPDNT